jgi:hypothetical protein
MYRFLIGWLRRNPIARTMSNRIEPNRRLRILRSLTHKDKVRKVSRALAGRLANLDDIEAFILAHATPLRAPLVLISQAHRSGGTLLSQLFDGHPALAAHPHELKIGYPTPEHWPPLDPGLGPEANFRMLFEARTIRLMRLGYTKREQDRERRSFFNVPRLQYSLFRHLFETAPPANPRRLLDHFFTAYFNAWLNYQGNLEQKRWITAFAPRLANQEANVAGFFDSYPNGRLIQLVRDPKTWYRSARLCFGRGYFAALVHFGGIDSAK